MDRKVKIEMYRLGVYFRRDKKGQRWLDKGQKWIESYESGQSDQFELSIRINPNDSEKFVFIRIVSSD